jgi:hypothetical protein
LARDEIPDNANNMQAILRITASSFPIRRR